MSSRPVNPSAIVFRILEEYQDKVRETLEAAGCTKELRNKILGDLYATNDVYLSLNRSYERTEDSFADSFTQLKILLNHWNSLLKEHHQ